MAKGVLLEPVSVNGVPLWILTDARADQEDQQRAGNGDSGEERDGDTDDQRRSKALDWSGSDVRQN